MLILAVDGNGMSEVQWRGIKSKPKRRRAPEGRDGRHRIVGSLQGLGVTVFYL